MLGKIMDVHQRLHNLISCFVAHIHIYFDGHRDYKFENRSTATDGYD